MINYYAVKKVKPLDHYMLHLTFSNGEDRLFDVKPYLDKGIFRELQDVKMFNSVRISFDTIQWKNNADFDPESLYQLSKKIKATNYPSNNNSLNAAAEPKSKYRKTSK